jgi:hypothetical protein
MAGETLVLAQLEIGTDGVVRGVATTGQAFDQLQRKTEDVGRAVARQARPLDVLTRQMFSLRSAAVALLGGFTLAGGIRSIAQFVGEAVRGTPEFKAWEASTTVLKNSLLEAVQTIPGFRAGIKEAADMSLRMAAAFGVAREHWLATIAATAVGGPIVGMNVLSSFTKDFNKALDEMQAKRDALLAGPPSPRFTPTSELLAPFGGGPIGLGDLEFENFEGISQMLERFSPFADQATAANQRFLDSLNGIGREAFRFGEEYTAPFRNFTETTVRGFADIEEKIDLTTEKMALWGVAAGAAGQLVTQALMGQVGDFKKFLAQMGAHIAGIAVTQGIIHLAAAKAATTLLGAIATGGTPAQHKAIAKFYFKTAAIAGGAALLLGSASGGEESGGSRGGRFPGGAPETPTRTQTINLFFEGGAFIGTNQQEFARDVKELLRQADDDNA